MDVEKDVNRIDGVRVGAILRGVVDQVEAAVEAFLKSLSASPIPEPAKASPRSKDGAFVAGNWHGNSEIVCEPG